MFGNITRVSVLQQYGSSPTDEQVGNLAASTINAGGNPFIIDWSGVLVTEEMLQTFAGVMALYMPASKGYQAPSAMVRMDGLPAWAITLLTKLANPTMYRG